MKKTETLLNRQGLHFFCTQNLKVKELCSHLDFRVDHTPVFIGSERDDADNGNIYLTNI